MVVLRGVDPTDEAMLLAWANDPATRAASRTHDRIAPADHHLWLQRKLASPDDARLWVGELEGVPIGVVRFERRAPTSVEVAITVAPAARGRRLARPLLEAGLAAARATFGPVTILADVLSGNEASIALFTGAGFTRTPAPASPAPDAPAIVSFELR